MTSIGISEFTRNISKVLHLPLKEKSDLLPSVLFDKIKDTTQGLTWTSIPRWSLFEHGNEEWGMGEFLALVQYKEGDELQILTDCLYQDDEAVLYKNIDRSTFEDAYGDKYGEEFFQPLDYVVIKNNEQVILLHHEGLLAFA
jgi:hypothetical protein